jgi:hypothetical protein
LQLENKPLPQSKVKNRKHTKGKTVSYKDKTSPLDIFFQINHRLLEPASQFDIKTSIPPER